MTIDDFGQRQKQRGASTGRNIAGLAILVGLVGLVYWLSVVGQRHLKDEDNAIKASACSPDKILIKSFSVTVPDCGSLRCPYVKIVGEAVNGCSEATGIKFRVIAKDRDGQIVDVREVWAGPFENVPPGPYPFNLTGALDNNPKAKTYALSVLETKKLTR